MYVCMYIYIHRGNRTTNPDFIICSNQKGQCRQFSKQRLKFISLPHCLLQVPVHVDLHLVISTGSQASEVRNQAAQIEVSTPKQRVDGTTRII